ncbi:MAG: acyl-CoA thioesterase [Planctomycetes bacterium]|nr:acyl-CoA thioesterase [Planctomycetota bacterium]
MSRVFVHRREIAFGDVDWARILYYPRFLHYCHMAFEAFMAEVTGFPYAVFLEERGLGFPTVRVEVDYSRPMPYGSVLQIEIKVARLGGKSMNLEYCASVDGGVRCAQARVTNVLVTMQDFRSLAIPDWLREGLQPWVHDRED